MSCTCPEQVHGGDRAAYLAQFTGHSTQSSMHMQHLRNLEEHQIASASSPPRRLDEDLVHPSLRRPMVSDLFTTGGGHQSCCSECKDTCQVLFSREDDGSLNYERLGMATAIADGQVLPEELPDQLSVPMDFSGLEYDWSAPSITQKEMTPDQVQRLHGCLKLFVLAMLAGVQLQLRLDPEETRGRPLGQNIQAVISLSRDLSMVLLSAAGVQRTVPLQSVRWVRPAAEEPGGLSWFLPSERGQMVVLRLAGNCFLRLRFQRQEQAAYFGTCMRLLLKAKH